MKDYQRTYRNKCKTRYVDFYIKDKQLYEYSRTINFNKFVKSALRKEMSYELNKGDDNG